MKFKVIALAALMGISGMAAQANELPDGPHIVTSGTASVDAVPDIATLAIEVNVAAKDAATAKKQADERVAQYISFLELNQIAKKDISSAGNDSNLLIVFYVQIMPDDLVMQLHRF